MATEAVAQLEAIRSMMAAGHRSVRIERHSLVLWGLAGAFLIVVTDLIFCPDRFEVWWQQAVASNLFTTVALLMVGFADYRLTQRARTRRGESLSFVQRQLTKVWWLLVGLIVVLNLGMSFFGGGLMFYPLVLTLLGLALYVQGLFSRQMLSWIGVTLILLGLGSMAAQPPFQAQKWLAVSVLGLGFPLLAMYIDGPAFHTSFARRVVLVAAWLLVVMGSVTALFTLGTLRNDPDVPQVSLSDFTADPTRYAEAAVHIPAGSAVPVQFTIEGGLLHDPEPLIVHTQEELMVVFKDGTPTGTFRVADGRWRKVHESLAVWVKDLSLELRPNEGPYLTAKTKVELR